MTYQTKQNMDQVRTELDSLTLKELRARCIYSVSKDSRGWKTVTKDRLIDFIVKNGLSDKILRKKKIVSETCWRCDGCTSIREMRTCRNCGGYGTFRGGDITCLGCDGCGSVEGDLVTCTKCEGKGIIYKEVNQ